MISLMSDVKKFGLFLFSFALVPDLHAQEFSSPPVFPDEAVALQLVEAAPSETTLQVLSEILMGHALRLDTAAEQAGSPAAAEEMQRLALEYAWRAVQADPESLAGLRFLGAKLTRHGEANRVLAIELLDRAQQIAYDEQLAFMLAGLLVQNGQHAEALELLEPLLESPSFRTTLTATSEAAATALLSNTYLVTGQLSRGKQFFMAAMLDRLASPSDWRALTQLMQGLGQSGQAASLLGAAMTGMDSQSQEYLQLEDIRLGLLADQLLAGWRLAGPDQEVAQ